MNKETLVRVDTERLARMLFVLFRASQVQQQTAGQVLLLTEGRPEVVTALAESKTSNAALEGFVRRIDPFVSRHIKDLDEARLRRFEEQLEIRFRNDSGVLKREVVDRDLLGKGLAAAAFEVNGKIVVSSLTGACPLKIEAYQILAKPYARAVVNRGSASDYWWDPVCIQIAGVGVLEAEMVNRLLATPAAVLTRALSRSEDLVRYLRVRRESPGVAQPAMGEGFYRSDDYRLLTGSLETMVEALEWLAMYMQDKFGNESKKVLAYLWTVLEYTVNCLSGSFVTGFSRDGALVGYRAGLGGLIRDIMADKQKVLKRQVTSYG